MRIRILFFLPKQSNQMHKAVRPAAGDGLESFSKLRRIALRVEDCVDGEISFRRQVENPVWKTPEHCAPELVVDDGAAVGKAEDEGEAGV